MNQKKKYSYPQITFRVTQEIRNWLDKTAEGYEVLPSVFLRACIHHAMMMKSEAALRSLLSDYRMNPVSLRLTKDIGAEEVKELTPEQQARRKTAQDRKTAQRKKRAAQEKQEQERIEAGFYKRK